MESPGVEAGLARIVEETTTWKDVHVEKKPDGVTELALGRGVLARLHDDGLVEIPYPRPVGDALVAAGRAERHHALPDSGWVNVRLERADQSRDVLELLRLAWEPRRGGAWAPGDPSRRAAQEKVDESGEETFPASDPPAHGQ